MSLAAEQWRQEGFNQGVKKGILQGFNQGVEKGVSQGKNKGKAELLLRLLRQRFPLLISSEIEARIDNAEGSQIDAWTDRVLSARNVTEIFAEVAQ